MNVAELLERNVRHLGFEVELEVERTTKALMILKPEFREAVLKHLAPKDFQAAVAQRLHQVGLV